MTKKSTAKFGEYDVEFKKLKLKDANILFPFVGSAMTKICLGDFDFFRGFKPAEVELFEEKLCEYTLKTVVGSDGLPSKRNLSLSDLEDNIAGLIPLLVAFLEFNFSFFSQAPKILDQLIQ